MSGVGVEVRRRAADAVHAVRFGGSSIKKVLPVAQQGLADSRDRALCESIVLHSCRWMHRYERLLDALLERPLSSKQPRIHALLLTGLAQLEALQLAPHAAISASAEVARAMGRPAFVGLVNAVLRRFQRERAALEQRLADDPEWRYSHPAWLLARLQQAYPDRWPELLEANNRPAPLWLRVNQRVISTADYATRLAEQGIVAQPHPQLPAALCLPQSISPLQLPGWSEGWVAVQDASAQWLTALLQPEPGQHVLDACAAPGGKAAALLEQIDGLNLLALDVSPERIARMRENFQRMRLKAKWRVADARTPEDWWNGRPFERVLLDVPCSATGVIRRQPDIKWHRREVDLAVLVALQSDLLEAGWSVLASGGRLVYATCSLLPEENDQQIAAFLARHADVETLPLAAELGEATPAGGRQRLPGDEGDGFFYAALRKRG